MNTWTTHRLIPELPMKFIRTAGKLGGQTSHLIDARWGRKGEWCLLKTMDPWEWNILPKNVETVTWFMVSDRIQVWYIYI